MRTSEGIREKLNSNVCRSENRIVELKGSLIKDISDLQNVIYFTAGEKKIIKKCTDILEESLTEALLPLLSEDDVVIREPSELFNVRETLDTLNTLVNRKLHSVYVQRMFNYDDNHLDLKEVARRFGFNSNSLISMLDRNFNDLVPFSHISKIDINLQHNRGII